MNILKFEVGPFAENTYLLTKNGEALLIDPGFNAQSEFNTFTERIENDELSLKAIVLTHAHVDHVLGLHQVLKKYDIPVYLSAEDHFLWNNFGNQATMFGFSRVGFSFIPETLPTNEKFTIGSFSFSCLYTPGHSPDHTSLYFAEQSIVIAGDALFKESVGRTDLYKGDPEVLERSIKTQLYTLPEETKVYPGHGPETTIAHEKKFNPFVRD